MKTWMKPTLYCCCVADLEKTIRIRAWSADDSPSCLDDFLNAAHEGMSGCVYIEGNYGHTVQVTVIGHFLVFGIEVKELLFGTGERRVYEKVGGCWRIRT